LDLVDKLWGEMMLYYVLEDLRFFFAIEELKLIVAGSFEQ
jgi:hypothetical protein